MALHLTPDILVGTYNLLRVTPPFRLWHLPEPEAISFVVGADPRLRGYHSVTPGANDHQIMLSVNAISRLDTALPVMAHEMIHLFQHIAGRLTKGGVHNADFHRLAARVCRHHGFDPKAF